MDHTTDTGGYSSSNDNAGRTNIYGNIHKGVRAFMCDTVLKVGALDLDDAEEVADTLTQVRELAEFCAGHLRHENDYVHVAMEARQPGSAMSTAGDHVHHLESIKNLERLAREVELGSGDDRSATLYTLQCYLSLFVAENFEHMHVEETANNKILWANYSDAEIAAVEQDLVASLSPREFGMCMRWMLVGMNPAERTKMLCEIRDNAPRPVFEGVLDTARAGLDSRNWKKLEMALGLDERRAA